MSSLKEKLDAIEFSVAQAKKIENKLETIKSVSKLHKSQQYELDMTKHTIQLGEKILKENGRLK